MNHHFWRLNPRCLLVKSLFSLIFPHVVLPAHVLVLENQDDGAKADEEEAAKKAKVWEGRRGIVSWKFHVLVVSG